MTMASQMSYPSGGRLGRRSRAAPRLLLSSSLAVALAAATVALVSLESNHGAAPKAPPAQKHPKAPPKILRSVQTTPIQASSRANAAPAPIVSEAPTTPAAPAATLAPAPLARQSGSAVKSSSSLAPSAQTPAALASTPNVPMPLPSQALSRSRARPAPIPAPARTAPTPAPSATAAHASATAAKTAFPSNAAPARAPAPIREIRPVAPAVEKAKASSGLFAAYLTSSTEEQARKSLVPLQTKYRAELKGHRLSYHRMRVNGASVYRVRAGMLSKTTAGTLCQQIQAAGGACEVGPE